ncbi:hypothetical protein CASFOL_013379 [Castilleja foliolosa]|uniref:C2H2-type domain-containing protein n=1 Tax=Castilleja foliolosa TaxID=1961234 RepID=A0ABD3DNP4_9LAMI
MMSSDVFSVPNPQTNPNSKPNPSAKRKRNLPGTPDPDAEVIALSPKSLMATNRFICEICNKGFQRDQNLQLHRRGHNLPWKLKQRANKDQIKKKVYICPEKTCVHHDPARALGDLTGIKKHFSRKHGEKKWKCEKCAKKYAVQSDWKAHSKTCGTREYKCDCGTLFSRKDSFITHRAFCDALAEESARFTPVGANNNLNFTNQDLSVNNNNNNNLQHGFSNPHLGGGFRQDFGAGNSILGGEHYQKPRLPLWLNHQTGSDHHHHHHQQQLMNPNIDHNQNPNNNMFSMPDMIQYAMKDEIFTSNKVNSTMSEQSLVASLYNSSDNNQNHNQISGSPAGPAAPMSATALLQKAAQMGSTKSNPNNFFGNTNSSSPSSSSTNTALLSFGGQNRNELDQVFGKQQQPENMAAKGGGGGYGMMSFGTAANNFDGQAIMQTPGGQSLNSGLHGVGNSLTRDFLGVGAGEGGGGGPFLPQELAKFASMSSALGLSHFTNNH